MAFLCPVRIKKHKRKGVPPRQLEAPLPGRITGSDSIDTLVRVGYEKERGPRARMVVVHDFVPCVDDELAVKRNQQVQVLYQENDWLYVLTETGKEGFIPYTYCLPIERSVDDFVLPRSKKSYLTHNVCDNSKFETTAQSNLQKTESKSMPDITCQNEKIKSSKDKRTENTHPAEFNKKNDLQKQTVSNKVSNKQFYTKQSHEDGILDHERAWSHHNQSNNVAHDYYNLMPHVNTSHRVNLNNSVQKDFNKNACSSKINDSNTMENSHVPNQSFGSGYKTKSLGTNRRHNSLSSTKSNPNHKYHSFRSQKMFQPPNNQNTNDKQTFKRSSSLYISPTTSTSHCRQHSLPENSSHNQSTESCVASHFSKKSYGQYIVLFNYTPRQENDVAVKRGEFVTLLNKEDEDWYWIRRTDAIEGFVPKTFLCPAEGQEDSSMRENHTLPKTNQSRNKPQENCENTSRSFSLQQATKLVCLYDYTAEAPDDLTVTRGQWLYADLESQSDPEWLWVYSTHTNKTGYIPRTYAKPPNFGTYPNSRNYDPFVSP